MSLLLQGEVQHERNNSVGLHPSHKSKFRGNRPFALINQRQIYKIQFAEQIAPEVIQISPLTKMALFELEDCGEITVSPFEPKASHHLTEVTFYISLLKRVNSKLQLLYSQLETAVKDAITVINHNANFFFKFKGIDMEFRPSIINRAPYGLIRDESVLNFAREPQQQIQIFDDSQDVQKMFEDYESKVKDLKVGGLHQQLELIDRRVFGTRMLHPRLMRQLGLKHIKGMLLYGPPGTGKTLIAREISKILKVEPKIVNGPEIFNQFVGKSEEKIRELFQDARKEQEEKGSKSQLHCIIFDEIDAICKKRGSHTSSGVYDLIVNQLLTCIDGINSLNNILVIGITNRKDLIDEAVLRPGRLEVHIEVNIPDEKGRLEVLDIHTELMRNNHFLDDSVNIRELARLTKNYTGAQLEGVVKSAQSFALEKWKNIPSISQTKERCKVTQEDFTRAISEVPPQFGKDNTILETILPKEKIIIPRYEQVRLNITNAINNLSSGKHSFLIRGEAGVGKTVLAAECAVLSDSSYTKIINCDRFLGLNEGQTMNEIVRIFEDAERCKSSFILIDDILRLIDFVPLGPRYNSSILNLLINLIKKVLDSSKKQIILATVTSTKEFEDLGMMRYFKHVFNLQRLNSQEICQILKKLGFENAAALTISREVQGSTVAEIVDTTNIEGKRTEEGWLKCWNQSKSSLVYGQ